MKTFVLSLALLLPLVPAAVATAQDEAPASETSEMSSNPRVVFETTKGTFTAEIYADKAPKTAANFLNYVDAGFYDGTIFHRVIPQFMAQGGGFTPDMTKKDTRAPIPNEANNGLKNERGTLAMARTGNPHSATAQFFVNVVANPSLDHRSEDVRGWGYAVFGRVVDGMDVVDAIVSVPTTRRNGMGDVPVEPVVIRSASRAQ